MRLPRSAKLASLPVAYALLRWFAQPPIALGWLVFLVPLPLLLWSDQPDHRTRRLGGYGWVYLAGFGYWLISLQGLRHANPLLYPAWIALSAYLAVYGVAFLIAHRRLKIWKVPTILAAPVAWVGCEWLRNYVLSGLSVCMLGHSLAEHPMLIQIADTLGTYGVSFVIAMIAAGIYEAMRLLRTREDIVTGMLSVGAAVVVLAACLVYGWHRLGQPTPPGDLNLLLVGLDEQTEYEQDQDREREIFTAYTRKTIEVITSMDKQSTDKIDVVVWPESMYSGAMPWMVTADDLNVPPEAGMDAREFRDNIEQWRAAYKQRAADMSRLIGGETHMIAGGGVIVYGERIKPYSGLVHVTPDGQIDWYGKTHLVLFGETIPILSTWSIFESIVPPGLGLARGKTAKAFGIDDTRLAANICIETAVERVAVNHFRQFLHNGEGLPDAIITVTNDAWFDHSSVVEHHLRCGQLVAVACRRPLLSAGNGGPTAWIDSCGRVVKRVPPGQAGHLLARPNLDPRIPAYLSLSDWPAAVMGLVAFASFASSLYSKRKKRSREAA